MADLKFLQQKYGLFLIAIFLIAVIAIIAIAPSGYLTGGKREMGAQYTLNVSKSGTGTGLVVSKEKSGDEKGKEKINCGSTCTANYNSGTNATLVARPATGSRIGGWTGCTYAPKDVTQCWLIMDSAKSVNAIFYPLPRYDLSVSKTGAGTGTVTSQPAGINCGADCTENYASGTAVTLTATSASGSTFGSWSGACSGTGTCTVTMNSTKSVSVTFFAAAPANNTTGATEIMDLQTLNPTASGFQRPVFVNNYVYFIPLSFSVPHGKVYRYNTGGNFTNNVSSSWTVMDMQNTLNSAFTNYNGTVYNGTHIQFVPVSGGNYAPVPGYKVSGNFTNNVSSSWTVKNWRSSINSADINSNTTALDANGYCYYIVNPQIDGKVARKKAAAC